MKTKMVKIDLENIEGELLNEAAKSLRNGGLVAFPTETVYGLGANVFDGRAVRSIFEAKGRPNDNPLIVHVSSVDEVEPLVKEIPEKARAVMEHFWPGPISIIMKKSDKIGSEVSAGLDTVAVRMPSNPVARALIARAGVPVAAPSANTSGKPSPTAARHVYEDMNGKIDYIIDGGRCDVGVESTVLDLSGDAPAILRPGGVSAAMLEPIIGYVISGERHVDGAEVPRAPGMKYRHYAPKAQVCVLEYTNELDTEGVCALAKEYRSRGKRVGVLNCADTGNIYNADVYIYGGNTSKEYAANLFYALRSFDEQGADVVLCPMCLDDDMSSAVKNRLYKAAAGNITDFEKGK